MPIPLIENKVEGPIYLYYELNRFYANHRRFTKSKEPEQLNGKYLDPEELQECDPVARIGDLYPSQRFAVATYSREEEVADPTGKIKEGDRKPFKDYGAPAIPCGLIARAMFNDTFQFFKVEVDGVHTEIDIA